MTKQQAIKLGRMMWCKQREVFETRPKYGELEEEYAYIHKGEYGECSIWDGRAMVFPDEDESLAYHMSPKEHARIKNKQIMAMKFRHNPHNNGKLAWTIPDGLTPNERKICENILNQRHVNRHTKIIRSGNGRPINATAIGKLAGITNDKTAQRAVNGLVNKGILKRVKRGVYLFCG